jgi:molecular chaperone DnaJ
MTWINAFALKLVLDARHRNVYHGNSKKSSKRETAMSKNYYRILGVDSDATPAQIKSAYRQKAKELHPDRSGGGCAPFHDIQEAYEILSSPARRRTYDDRLARESVALRTSRPPVPSRHGPVEPLIPTERSFPLENTPFDNTIYPSSEQIFSRLWGSFDDLAYTRAERTQDIHLELVLTWEQARHGGRARIGIPVQVTCPACRGRGRTSFFSCRHCAGGGLIASDYPLSFSFPAGVPDGATARMPLDELGLPGVSLLIHFRMRW